MSTKELTCRQCGTHFEYAMKEYNRQTKKGRGPDEFYCSIGCGRRWRNAHRSPEEQARLSVSLSERSKGNAFNRKGKFTAYLALVRKRPQWETDLDDTYLSELWDKQAGLCRFSRVPMTLKKGKNTLTTASLDRIDSKIGYVRGNVQFVCYGLNLAKSTFTDAEMVEFMDSIRRT